MKKRWIQTAIKKPNALRNYVRRRYGRRGFTKRGSIKVSVLKKLAKSENKTIRARARLALTLRRLRKKKR